jgi:hypothetical protein
MSWNLLTSALARSRCLQQNIIKRQNRLPKKSNRIRRIRRQSLNRIPMLLNTCPIPPPHIHNSNRRLVALLLFIMDHSIRTIKHDLQDSNIHRSKNTPVAL